MRADLTLTNKRGDEEDNRLLMKSLPSKVRFCKLEISSSSTRLERFSLLARHQVGAALPQLSGVARDIVCDLLDALTVPVPPDDSTAPTSDSTAEAAAATATATDAAAASGSAPQAAASSTAPGQNYE